MEVKDTIINASELEDLIQHIHGRKFPTTEEELGELIAIVCRRPVEFQAQISFEAGKQEGKREVVEWIKQNAGLGAKTIEELNTGYSFIPIRSDKWQAILKE